MANHGISFETACEVFFDPFVESVGASRASEFRLAAIGMASGFRLLFVVHVERNGDIIRIISARKATPHERRAHEEDE